MRRITLLMLAMAFGTIACNRSSTTLMPVADDPATVSTSEQSGTANAAASGDFAFPDDRGGKLLTELLAPSEKSRPVPIALPSAPRSRTTPASIQEPGLPLPANQADPAKLPPKSGKGLGRPVSLPEEPPLTSQRGELSLPKPAVLPAGERTRIASVDVKEPPAPPILAQPVNDRVSLEDPTLEASQAVGLSAPPPDRTVPAPVVRQTTADPFENRQAGKAPQLPPDDPTPVATTPKPPKN